MEVGVFSVVQTGDIGGQGVSRFCIMNATSTSMSNTELNAAAAAIAAIYTAMRTSLPTTMSFAVQNTCRIIESTTGALVAIQNIPTVSVVTGNIGGSYVAGTGARMYWHTNQVRNRRMIRGATYMTPLQNGCFTTSGALQGSTTGPLMTAGNAYILACEAATLQAMVLCRPTTKNATDGTAAPIVACSVSSTPASLRTRRS